MVAGSTEKTMTTTTNGKPNAPDWRTLPRKPEGTQCRRRTQTYVSEPLYALMRDRARERGLSMSVYLRELLVEVHRQA